MTMTTTETPLVTFWRKLNALLTAGGHAEAGFKEARDAFEEFGSATVAQAAVALVNYRVYLADHALEQRKGRAIHALQELRLALNEERREVRRKRKITELVREQKIKRITDQIEAVELAIETFQGGK